MGFSLESAVAIPCCLAILAQSVGMAGPLSKVAVRTARLCAWSAQRRAPGSESCRYITEEKEGCFVYRVETEPQKIVESLAFIRDFSFAVKHALKAEEQK